MTRTCPRIGPSPFGPSQTIVQLYHELASSGLGASDLAFLCRIHEHVSRLFAGQMRPSGRPFTCHTIGTASIAAKNGGSLAEIAAGLLHAAYEFGDFGSHVSSASRTRRQAIVDVAGEEVEAIVYALFSARWPELRSQIAIMDDYVARCSPAEISALFLRLCNEIEQLPDLPFSSERDRQRCLGRKECFLAIAASLGRSDLTRLYEDGHRLVVESTFLDFNVYAYLLPPASYTKRLSARAREFVFNRLHWDGVPNQSAGQ